MIGRARHPDLPSAVAAALDRAVGRARGLFYDLQGALCARLNLYLAQGAAPAAAAGAVGAPLIPILRYRDVPAAVTWLCRAFGMQVHRIVTDSGGAARYAELTVGSGMLMVAPIEDTVFGKLLVQPDEIGGVETQICYLYVANARAHHARAKAAGAVIIIDPEHESNNGRGYSCRDPEGHVWNFGTYDPWQKKRSLPASPAPRGSLRPVQHGLAALIVLVLAGGLLIEIAPQPSASAGTAAIAPPPATSPLTGDAPHPETAATITTEAAPAELEERSTVQTALSAAERAAAEARAQLEEARGALERAQREAATARAQLEELQRAKQAAERTAADARERLASAQKSADRAREEAAQERLKRLAADRVVVGAKARASIRSGRSRAAGPRSWCYSAASNQPPNASARLAGFCKA
ncbi:MAG: VOC family protein [Hyphomicrobiaceae bacterium]|nr:VOC family protein [Hyphomicrobiaceae bacterium]